MHAEEAAGGRFRRCIRGLVMDKKYQIRHAGGRYWLLDMEQSGLNYKASLSLNESAGFIYERLVQGKDVWQIAEDMSVNFGIGKKEAIADIDEFIRQMVKKGIIREG